MARRLLISVLAFGALLALPGVANAASPDVCVWNQTLASPAPASCGSVYAFNASGLSTAISVAGFQVVFDGETTVRIGPGDLLIDAPVTITPTAEGPIHIVGSGRDLTKLQLSWDATALTGLSFDATAQPTSSISDLTVEIPSQLGGRIGVNAKGGTITRTRFYVASDSESSHRGLWTTGTTPTTVTDSVFELSGTESNELSGIVAGSDVIVSGVTMNGSAIFNGQVGILTTGANSNVVIDSSRFENLDPAVRVEKGTVKILDSLILNPLEDIDTGIQFASTGASDAALITSGVTLAGAFTGVNISTTTPSPNVDLNNTIIQTKGLGSADIACARSTGLEPDVTFRNSILKLDAPSALCHFTQIGVIDRSVSPPVFAGTDDYRPAAGSPQIDAGNVIWPTMMMDPTPLVDLAGAARVVDGNGDGTATIDIGANEFQPTPPGSGGGGGGGGTTTPAALSITFGKAVGKFRVKPKPKGFKLTSKRTKPRLPITSSAKVKIKLTLKKGKKKLKGSQSLTIPAGTSYVTFSGKWNKKKLKPGRYTVYLTAPGLKDAPKSILNLIR